MSERRGPAHPRAGWRGRVADQAAVAAHLARWVVLGAASGALAGVASWGFLEALERATDARLAHPWLLFLLPVAGAAIGVVHHRWAGRAAAGSALLLDEIHTPSAWVPRRMAPLVFAGTVASHLFGASVGREGTALQMSGSLTDLLSRTLRLGPADRRILLITALAGGFGSVFGVPLAGAVFALEVQAVGRVRHEALLPALTASIVGDLVVGGLGHHHPLRPPLDLPVDGVVLARVAVAGIAFGLVATAFSAATRLVASVAARWIAWPPARLVAGGVATVGLTLLVGRDELGLSLPLVDQALAGVDPGPWTFAAKLAFTALALGSGFPGGEVTPLFVIGATLGGALAGPLDLPTAALAAVGFVAVFAGAANTPLACTIMGVELFGAGAVLPVAVGCVVAYVTSGHRGIYPSQRIEAAKGPHVVEGFPTVAEWHRRRGDR
ncbi:MAG: chloride channel protein [Acidimicrobiia bacterium]